MVHRTVPRSDLDAARRGERGGDVALREPRGLGQVESPGKPGRDRRRQRAAGAVGASGRDPLRRKPRDPARFDQEVDALGARAVATLDGDVLQGDIAYTPNTNDSPDCGVKNDCQNLQAFNGTRPPSSN